MPYFTPSEIQWHLNFLSESDPGLGKIVKDRIAAEPEMTDLSKSYIISVASRFFGGYIDVSTVLKNTLKIDPIGTLEIPADLTIENIDKLNLQTVESLTSQVDKALAAIGINPTSRYGRMHMLSVGIRGAKGAGYSPENLITEEGLEILAGYINQKGSYMDTDRQSIVSKMYTSGVDIIEATAKAALIAQLTAGLAVIPGVAPYVLPQAGKQIGEAMAGASEAWTEATGFPGLPGTAEKWLPTALGLGGTYAASVPPPIEEPVKPVTEDFGDIVAGEAGEPIIPGAEPPIPPWTGVPGIDELVGIPTIGISPDIQDIIDDYLPPDQAPTIPDYIAEATTPATTPSAETDPWKDLIDKFKEAGISTAAYDIWTQQRDKEARERYEDYLEALGRGTALAEKGAGIGRTRAEEDYAAQQESLGRSQHIQNILQQESLTERGILPSSQSTIGAQRWRETKESQAAERGEVETGRRRRLEDIGLGLERAYEEAGLRKEQAREAYKEATPSYYDYLRESGMGTSVGAEALDYFIKTLFG